MSEAVLYNIDKKGVAWVTINRPEKLNAFDDKMVLALTHCFEQATTNQHVRAVVLSSLGKHFSAGADLAWMKRMVGYTENQNCQDALQLATMLNTLYNLPKPTIARIQGAAYGGAVGLVACCDIAVACKLSKFSLSEVKLGLTPATISPYVVEAMGKRIAKRYFLTAEVFSAHQARRLGLINETVSEDQLDTQIQSVLSAILQNGPVAVSKAKSLINTVAGKPIDSALLQFTSETIASIRVSEEGQEGVNAFLEKRIPSWQLEGYS